MENELQKYGIKNSDRTKCEVWTRVMGYHRPVDSFNIGKQGEVAERKYFDVLLSQIKSKEALTAPQPNII